MPTFVACQWTDEQTGGHCPTLADAMTGTDKKWFTFTNGTHIDSLDPETFNRFYDFLQLYVAKRKPDVNPVLVGGAPAVYELAAGVHGVTMPPDPIQMQPDYESAKALFEAQKHDPHPLRQRRGQRGRGQSRAWLRAVVRQLPGPGHDAPSRSTSASDGSLTVGSPSAGGRGLVQLGRLSAPVPPNFTGDTGAGTNGLWTATPPYDWVRRTRPERPRLT